MVFSSCVTFFLLLNSLSSRLALLDRVFITPPVSVCLFVCLLYVQVCACVYVCAGASLSLSLSLGRYTCHTAADCLSIYTLCSLYSRRYLSPAPRAGDDVRSTMDQRVKNQPSGLSDLLLIFSDTCGCCQCRSLVFVCLLL